MIRTFTYTMTEQYGKLSGFEYSNELYTIKVHVSDNRDGSLKVDTKVTNSWRAKTFLWITCNL